MVLVVVGIVFYSALAILLGPRPIVTFSAISLSSGNATIGVASASQAVSPSNYRVNLQVGQVTGTAVVMPTTGGTFVNFVVSGTTYRIYWTDIGGENTVNSGDNFRITGNGVRLPDATAFTFYFLWREGSSIQSAVWTTP